MVQTQYQRFSAVYVPISEIFKYEYKKGVAQFDPNYLDAGCMQISRVSLTGVVIDNKTENGSPAITIDDKSSTIEVREFVDPSKQEGPVLLNGLNIGNLITVIGKIKEFGGQRYVQAEIVKKTTADWLKFSQTKARITELNLKIKNKGKNFVQTQQQPAQQTQSQQQQQNQTQNDTEEEQIMDAPLDKIVNKAEIICKIIDEEDKGSGVLIKDIIEKSNMDDCEKIINDLLENGDIFMVQPGKVKVLN